MIFDVGNLFADAEATGNIGTRLIGDVLDLEEAKDLGNGQPLYLMVLVDTAIAAGSGGTYQVALTSGTDATLASPVNHVLSGVFDAEAGVVAGTVLLHTALPLEGTEYKQFVGIREIVAAANTSAGKITAFLTIDPHAYKAYTQGTVEA